jgi:hypothetical protein
MMFKNLKSYLVQIKLRQKIVNQLIDSILNNELKKIRCTESRNCINGAMPKSLMSRLKLLQPI